MNLIIRLLITAVSAFLLSKVIKGVHFDSIGTAIVFAIVLGLLNTFIKPILSLFSLPITLITLGLFSFVINGLIILIAERFIQNMYVDGMLTAIIFSILLSIVSSLFSSILGKN